MADSRAIGIFDSGLGGLTVAREIIKRLPKEDIVYFGDTGRVPYGTRSKETIRKYAAEDENFLLSHSVKLIVAACGTVSSVTQNTDSLPVPFFEMITHAALAAVKATKTKKIGAIGTPATIKSGSHKNAILKLMPEAEVTAASCSLFVPLVEEGWFSSDDIVVSETVKRYLEPIIKAECDTLILGCTHYPVLEDVIRSVLGENVTLINPGTAVAEAVKEYLDKTDSKTEKHTAGEHNFYVSDKPDSFKNLASVLLGEEIDETNVKKVDLNNLC